MDDIKKIKNILIPYYRYQILDRKMKEIQLSNIKDYDLLLLVDNYFKYKYYRNILFFPLMFLITKKRYMGFSNRRTRINIYFSRLIKIYLCSVIYINFVLIKFKLD
jgi:hypothetical protein